MAKSLNLLAVHEELKHKHISLRNEYQVIKRKLDSKNDALLILSRDLAESQAERDQFKLMADQLRNRCQALKKQLQSDKTDPTVYQCPINTIGITSQLEVDDLKQRLADAEGDIKILREKIIKHRLGTSEQQQSQRKMLSVHERDELIQQIEKSQLECTQLEQDMKQLLDLKEELETERDTYKSKYNRLNTELNFIMRGDEKHVVDIDALIMENRFLQQRVKQLQEENSVVSTSLKKYKYLIEKKKPAGILKATTNNLLGGVLISQRQVKQLLSSPDNSSTASQQVVQELKGLASTLLETINDKNLALNHQRKSNKLLASRITDLENKLREVELSVDANFLRERFEGWSELREDCTNIKSLIPLSSVGSSEADTANDLEDAAKLLSDLADADVDSCDEGANETDNNNCPPSPSKSGPAHVVLDSSHVQEGSTGPAHVVLDSSHVQEGSTSPALVVLDSSHVQEGSTGPAHVVLDSYHVQEGSTGPAHVVLESSHVLEGSTESAHHVPSNAGAYTSEPANACIPAGTESSNTTEDVSEASSNNDGDGVVHPSAN